MLFPPLKIAMAQLAKAKRAEIISVLSGRLVNQQFGSNDLNYTFCGRGKYNIFIVRVQ